MKKCYRSSPPEALLGKVILKKCSKCIGEHQCRSAVSIRLLCNFIEIALRHRCSPVNLLYIFRTPFLKNTSETPLNFLFSNTLFRFKIFLFSSYINATRNYYYHYFKFQEYLFALRRCKVQQSPLNETHLDAVKGLILLRGSNPVHQQEELVGAMVLRSTRTSRSFLMHC